VDPTLPPDDLPPLFRVEGGPPLPDVSASDVPEAWVRSSTGRRLRVARFEPAGVARGSVVLSTGRTEPLEKYGEVAVELVARGFVVLLHDWAGQGCSGRFVDDQLRGDLVGGADSLLADYTAILNAYAARLPKPWIASGHSMGAALTCLALGECERRFAGAVLCAPMIEFSVPPLPFWLIRSVVRAANLAGRGAALARAQVDPTTVSFEDNLLTHDRVRYERTRRLLVECAALRLGEPTWRWLAFAVDLRDRLARPGAAERIACPLAVVAAGEDRIVSTPATRGFVARVPGASYSEAPGAFHEILMETDERRARFWEAFDALAARVGAE
jgi:lysophospholipase